MDMVGTNANMALLVLGILVWLCLTFTGWWQYTDLYIKVVDGVENTIRWNLSLIKNIKMTVPRLVYLANRSLKDSWDWRLHAALQNLQADGVLQASLFVLKETFLWKEWKVYRVVDVLKYSLAQFIDILTGEVELGINFKLKNQNIHLCLFEWACCCSGDKSVTCCYVL